ncbi:hypothetical protein [Thalassotalea maritima]|uniref:hypothetical protein n=1 Tax=Thalassotalea maritima TaxID=3242416 RepID=UPI003526F350
MNRHTKVAIFIAPFLLLGGYIAADYWAKHTKGGGVYQLTPEPGCDVVGDACLLQSGDLKIKLTQQANLTKINTTFAMDELTLMVVKSGEVTRVFPMQMQDSPFYWQSETHLPVEQDDKAMVTLRLVAVSQGDNYISEFKSVGAIK